MSNDSCFDLFIIGGGINGSAIASDAASRGLSVGLAEMQDFGEGTSSRSSKLIHGGLRYLETYDFKLVRHALIEREILMRRTPHLVWPIRLVLPHVKGQRPRWMIRLGLFFYDHLTRLRVLKKSRTVKLHKHLSGAPLKDKFRHAFAYSDCRGDDARLVIANLLGAERDGATIYPRFKFIDAERKDGLWYVTLERSVGSEVTKTTIQTKALVNTAGPWVVDVSAKIKNITIGRKLRMVKGSHLVVPRLWEGEHGYFLQTEDGRLMEAFPYEEDFTFIGTTDEPWEQAPEDVEITDDEVDYMLREVNAFLSNPVTRDNIVWSFSGVRPLFEAGSGRDGDLSTLTRDYSFEIDRENGEAPLLTVFGGKLTTHRRLAEEAMQNLCAIFPWPSKCNTRRDVLPGGEPNVYGPEGFADQLRQSHPWLPEKQARRYARTYGARANALLDGVQSIMGLGQHFGADLYEREIQFLRKTEWAETVDDIIWRRTKVGLRLTQDEVSHLREFLDNTRR